ncbi:MAG: transposase [Planctomycetes bacterium]|nr:transposase [Planctomycetota bacterium]
MKACPTYRVWFRDDAGCAAAIRSGGAFEVEASSYGANDVVLEFLVASGLWGLLVSMEPDGLHKDNGKPWWALVGEKYGYKLVLLLNAAEGRERVVGCVLAPLQCGERAMLRIVLRALGRRWVVEDQGFRELTQDWALDTLAGRRFNALNARIAFALMLYNADRLLRAKHPDLWEEARRRPR